MASWPLNVTDTSTLGARLAATTGIITIREVADDGTGATLGTGAFDPAGASDYIFAIHGSYKAD